MPADRNTVKGMVSAYASSILEASGRRRDNVLLFHKQLEELVAAYYANSSLSEAFDNADVDVQRRVELAEGVFFGFEEGLREILVTMAVRGDMSLIRRITDEFVDIAEKDLGVVIVTVVTAIALDDELRDKIRAKLAGDFGRDALLQERIDPGIIGGIIMSAHGHRIDASIATMLEESRIALSSPITGGER